MTVLALAFFGVASTSLLLAIALLAAFQRFGRVRHATYWASAFALIALDHTLMAMRLLTPGSHTVANLVACTASLSGATLVALGFRERSGLREQGWFLGSLAIMALGCGVLVVRFPDKPVHHPVVTAYVVVMLFFSIRALRRGPERELAQGGTTLAMMSLFMAFFGALTILGLMTDPWGALSSQIYHAVYVLGVPASLTGIGLFALFLLAEDLAHGMRHLAIVDPLTGLLNRRGFEEAARRVKAQCRRSRTPVCVAVVDLDHFKSINDRFGHAAGDLALSEFARRLQSGLRQGDLVSRAGGEEFVLLLPGVNASEVSDLLNRLRITLSSDQDDDALGFTMPTASFGAVEIGPRDLLTTCIERADLALYRAKRDGRDCVRVDLDHALTA
ncbi:GGDEF domain-containing protein [Novosphingobium rosa]|uniref:GGDEF domain-containing protein n=1 Tax=Novosphingobium rosa TaxID=76978 RepID=UPI000836C45A|nr:GGDEF domain-containing protein [Novosphingobium rosa]